MTQFGQFQLKPSNIITVNGGKIGVIHVCEMPVKYCAYATDVGRYVQTLNWNACDRLSFVDAHMERIKIVFQNQNPCS